MKIREGFILHEMHGKTIALPVNGDMNTNSMITLNEAGSFLWKLLRNDIDEDSLVAAVLEEYDTDEQSARKRVDEFIQKLSENGFLA